MAEVENKKTSKNENFYKKIVSLIIVLVVLAALLVGCAGKFDMDKSIEKLKGKGLTEGMCYITEEECERVTSLTNSKIKFISVEFRVEIIKKYELIKNGTILSLVHLLHLPPKNRQPILQNWTLNILLRTITLIIGK